MLEVTFRKELDAEFKVLCMGAHSDDIEIGCGGTILRLIQNYSHLNIVWVVFNASEHRRIEAESSAEEILAPVREKRIIIKDFKDGFFPYVGTEIKIFFESLKGTFSPDLILTHYRHDLHQDHRLISELTWNTYRNHLIMEYEIPKYDGDIGNPNFFVHLDQQTCDQKIDHLLRHFASQRDKHWFTNDAFLALLRLRGMESRALDSFAEAFYTRKIVF
jgi:LmbE family N-acetylglucosaminyl deacetylase